MATITLDERELVTIRAALRLFRFAINSQSDYPDLTREQSIELGSAVCAQVMTSKTGDLIAALEPARIDDLIERLTPVP